MGREHFSGPVVSNKGIDVGSPSERWTMLDGNGLFYLTASTQELTAVTAAPAGTIKLQYTSSGGLVLASSNGAIARINTSTI